MSQKKSLGSKKGAGKQGSRRKGRTMAFQFLYGASIVPEQMDYLRASFLDSPAVMDEKDMAARDFAWELVQGVCDNLSQLDSVVERFSKHWKIARIAKVELAILRLSIFEMLKRPDIPLRVAINEGVELSKSFGDDHSKSFINGILDAAAKAIDAGDFEVRKEV